MFLWKRGEEDVNYREWYSHYVAQIQYGINE